MLVLICVAFWRRGDGYLGGAKTQQMLILLAEVLLAEVGGSQMEAEPQQRVI